MLSIFTKKPKVVVHSGKFHPDDVTAVAIISLYLEKPVKVFRSRDPQVWEEADYVFDVGGIYDPAKNRFDHHQPSFNEKRENGISYSSAGLAWKHFGEKVAGSHEVWQKIENKIIQPIDAEDNAIEIYHPVIDGIAPYSFGDFLFAFNPTRREQGDLRAFLKAVEEAKKMLLREISRTVDHLKDVNAVKNIYTATADKRMIILDEPYSWRKAMTEFPEPLFVIVPRPDTASWGVETVDDPSAGKFARRLLFPESWAAKRDDELAGVTGVPDAMFCHKGRFLAIARSKEGAIALAKLALNQNTH